MTDLAKRLVSLAELLVLVAIYVTLKLTGLL